MKPRLYKGYTEGAEFVVGGGWLRPDDHRHLRELPSSRRTFAAMLNGTPSEFVRSFVLAEVGEFMVCVAGNGRRGSQLAPNYSLVGASDYAALIEQYRNDPRWREVR